MARTMFKKMRGHTFTERGKMAKRTGLIIWVLSLLLAVAVIYIAFTAYQTYTIEQDRVLYVQGLQEGFATAVGQVFSNALTCNPVPVTFQNQTINLIAVECLQQQAAASQQALQAA